MPPDRYSPLPEGSIRLLRLFPDQDKRSLIRCQLLDSALLDSEGVCPYECLSYVWGSEDEPQSISVDGRDLSVGKNLHVALSHLRHGFVERILWIDAVCINQQDPVEKGHQVQSMAKIYAKANSVVVWLGEASSDDRQALEEIRKAAARRPTGFLTEEDKQQGVFGLLQRPWFQRIWVLQEVAAARHVLIKCGPVEIDGHAFCSGLSALDLSYAEFPELQALVRPVTQLIRGAIFRSRHATSQSPRFSLEIGPLSELIELYYTRKATQRHDKVYALLGMSSDDPGGAGLSVDYQIPWGRLLRRLIKFILSEKVSVDVWDDKEMAVIKGKVRILGEVTSVQRHADQEDRLTVEINWATTWTIQRPSSRWSVQASAKPVQARDIVCLVQGASRPTILRVHNDILVIILMTVPDGPITVSSLFQLPEPAMSGVTSFSRDLRLIWDWNMGPDSLPEAEDDLDSAARLGSIGLVLQDVGSNYCVEHAAQKFRKTVGALGRALNDMDSKGHPQREGDQRKLEAVVDILTSVRGGWLPLKWALEEGHERVVRLLLSNADPSAKDEVGQMPISWAATNGHDAVIMLLFGTGKVDPDIQDENGQTPLLLAASNGHEAAAKSLLDTNQVDPDAKDKDGQTPLLLAAKNGHEEVVKLLLIKADPLVEDEYGRIPLRLAAENRRMGVVRLLIETGDHLLDIKSKDYFHQHLQHLYSQIEQWVLRFSTLSDTRQCRLTSEMSKETVNQLEGVILENSAADILLRNHANRKDILMAVMAELISEEIFSHSLFGLGREERHKLWALEALLLDERESFKRQCDLDADALAKGIWQTLAEILPTPPDTDEMQVQLRTVVEAAGQLSITMRTQKAQYEMLPYPKSRYWSGGKQVEAPFEARCMNAPSDASNEDLEAQRAIVRAVLFPLVSRTGDDGGYGNEWTVVYPAQVVCSWRR